MQEGWRMAVAKRAKEELATREAALRTHLMHQRDQQLQVTHPPLPLSLSLLSPSFDHACSSWIACDQSCLPMLVLWLW